MRELEMCEWEEDADGIWSCSNCTIAWCFNDQGPKENSVNYCPKCGKGIIKFSPYEEEQNEA